MKISSQPVRGTKDYLPAEAALRDYLQGEIAATYHRYGFQKIGTPAMEDIERLNKSDGGENLAMIFKILKRGQKLDLSKENLSEDDLADSGLRYDLTMPLSRYYANNRANLRTPFKSIQMDRVFRAERPQKGRFREFIQCDIDIIGDSSLNAEMELIAATTDALLNIGISGFTLRLNDRRLLTGMIKAAGFAEEEVAAVCIIFDKLDKIGADGVKKELEEHGFAAEKIAAFAALVEKMSGDEAEALEAVRTFAGDTAVADGLKRVLEFARGISGGKYQAAYDPSLVRGMGYYTGMVFEIVSPDFGGSIAGGGRYDNMIGKFLGETVPAVGFSIGFERICALLLDKGYQLPAQDKAVLVYNGEDDFAEVVRQARKLQERGMFVTMVKRGKKLGKQIDALVADGYNYMANAGEDNLKELKA